MTTKEVVDYLQIPRAEVERAKEVDTFRNAAEWWRETEAKPKAHAPAKARTAAPRRRPSQGQGQGQQVTQGNAAKQKGDSSSR
jgi:hypothetical protein